MFKIKNKEVKGLFELLIKLDIPVGMLSRKRSKFANMLKSHYDEYMMNGRDELIMMYAKKDENGDVLEDEGGNIRIDNMTAFTNELNILENEFFTLDTTDTNLQLFEDVYSVLMNDEYIVSLKGKEALIHDNVCTELERVLNK